MRIEELVIEGTVPILTPTPWLLQPDASDGRVEI